jgi:uncharacterized protein (TIGR02271 family)
MTREQLARLSGQSVYDNKGQKIGDVRRVFFDDATDEPAWVSVGAHRFDPAEAVVPLAGSRITPTGLAVAVRSRQVKDAPTVDPDSQLSADETAQLISHYEQRGADELAAGSAEGEPGRTELTRFEEQFEVGAETVETGRTRLHKRVATEPVEATVPLRHEKVRVEHMPARQTVSAEGHRFGEETAEITVHDQRPTSAKRTVPVETVQLATEATTDEQRVTDEVRREFIDVEDQPMGQTTEEPAGARRRR